LLTREAIRSYGLPFAGWIANKMRSEMALADANIDSLASRFGAAPLGIVPAGGGGTGKGMPGIGSSHEIIPIPGIPFPVPPPPWAVEVANKLVSP
jgi:hypothetical protein